MMRHRTALRRQNHPWASAVLAAAIAGGLSPAGAAPAEPHRHAAHEHHPHSHPDAPPALSAYGKTFELGALENPLRLEVLGRLQDDPQGAWQTYQGYVAEGREVYYQECFYCHGDLLDGKGHFIAGLDPPPTDFQDPQTIGTMREAALFWRIVSGARDLPEAWRPWDSSMPAYEERLDEEAVWKLIMFLYDYVGQVPPLADAALAKAAAAMKAQIELRRANLEGKALYDFRCAACHGELGEGDGPAADYLYPRPADFSLALFKYKHSPQGELPLDDDLFLIIKFGLSGGGMPSFRGLLNDRQIRSLLPVIKGFDVTASWAPEDGLDFDDDGRYLGDDFRVVKQREPLTGKVPYSAESIERGRTVYDKACAQCHGEQGRGNIASDKRLKDDWGRRIWPRDLTKPWTWRATHIPGPPQYVRDTIIDKIYIRLTNGIPGTPMPANRTLFEGQPDPISTEDRWHLANYVYALRETAAPPAPDPALQAVYLDGPLPETVDAAQWGQAPAVTLHLIPNVIAGERLFTPLNDAITVRALYNDRELAFLLEVNDRTDSRPGEPVSSHIHDQSLPFHSDAFAIELPKAGAFGEAPAPFKPRFGHGDPGRAVTLWYWNAGAIEPPEPARAVLFDTAGLDAAPRARTGQTDLFAIGRWTQGRWQVVMKRPLRGADGDVDFTAGGRIPIAFANWDGNNGERGARHTLTGWQWLSLAPPQGGGPGRWGLVLLAGAVLVGGGLLLRRVRG